MKWMTRNCARYFTVCSIVWHRYDKQIFAEQTLNFRDPCPGVQKILSLSILSVGLSIFKNPFSSKNCKILTFVWLCAHKLALFCAKHVVYTAILQKSHNFDRSLAKMLTILPELPFQKTILGAFQLTRVTYLVR